MSWCQVYIDIRTQMHHSLIIIVIIIVIVIIIILVILIITIVTYYCYYHYYYHCCYDYVCVCVHHCLWRLVDPFSKSCETPRLNEFFKLRISTNLLISQFLEMADDASQGRHLAADGDLMILMQRPFFSPFGNFGR